MNRRRARAAFVLLAASLAGFLSCSRAEPVSAANSPALEALLERCRASVDARPSDAGAQAELALAFEANGHWVEAARQYARARELQLDEPLWATHAAICETEAGELDRARRTLEAAALRFPDCGPILQRLGLAQLEDGDFARAEASFGSLEKLDGCAVAGSTGLAEVLLARGATEPALKACERALAVDPAYRLPRYLRAVCLRELGRAPEAAREFELSAGAQRRMLGDKWSSRAAEFAVGFEARFARAAGWMEGGHAAEALAAFAALARERPEDVRTLGNLAMAQAATGDFSAALESCDAALARAPDSAPLHGARARVLLGAGRSADALAAARRASELDPRDAGGFDALGLALAACGERQAALAAWQEALRLDPSNSALRQRVEALERR